MRVAWSWLSSYLVAEQLSIDDIAHQLTMAGLEADVIKQEDEWVLDVHPMPNRGDCLSVQGLAREIAAVCQLQLRSDQKPNINLSRRIDRKTTGAVLLASACPHFCTLRFKSEKLPATPTWLVERLAAAGLSSKHVVLDVLQYVMLYLGQPMHAYDADKLTGPLALRFSTDREKVTLLHGESVQLQKQQLLVVDDEKIVAIAGLMGSLSAAVDTKTDHFLIESAYFYPEVLANQAQRLKIKSEAAYRFERGVDPSQIEYALDQVVDLLSAITQITIQAEIHWQNPEWPQVGKQILWDASAFRSLMGFDMPKQQAKDCLERYGCHCETHPQGWLVQAPSWRYDLQQGCDLHEELVRADLLSSIQATPLSAQLALKEKSQWEPLKASSVLQSLVDMGYRQIISYSFIDPAWLLDTTKHHLEIMNPISSHKSVMRPSLWPGLMQGLQYNQLRQQFQIKLFESGRSYTLDRSTEQFHESERIAGLVTGTTLVDAWRDSTNYDLFLVKGELDNLFQAANLKVTWQEIVDPYLQPGCALGIYAEEKIVVCLGQADENWCRSFDMKPPVWLFDIDRSWLLSGQRPPSVVPHKFPPVWRDLAFLVSQDSCYQDLYHTILKLAVPYLQEVWLFDHFKGAQLPSGYSSYAIGLRFQSDSHTLDEDIIVDLMNQIIAGCAAQGYPLRDAG